MCKILIVDDSAIDRDLMKAMIERGHKFYEATNIKDAYDKIVELHPDLMILDNRLPDGLGYHFLHRMSLDKVDLPPTIFVSGIMEGPLKRNSEALGTVISIEKSQINQKTINALIHQILEKKSA